MNVDLPSKSSAWCRARSSALLFSTTLSTNASEQLLMFDFAVPLLQSTIISFSSALSPPMRTGGLSPWFLAETSGRGGLSLFFLVETS